VREVAIEFFDLPGASLALIELGFDLDSQDVSRPAILSGLADAPKGLRYVLNSLNYQDIMTPRNLCNKLFHIFRLLGIETVPLLDEVDVPPREPFESGKFLRQVVRNLLNNAIPPAAALLPLTDQPTDIPVEIDQLAVDGDRGLNLGGLDPRLELGDELPIVLGCGQILRHGRKVEAKLTQCNRVRWRISSPHAASSFFSG